MALSFFKRKNVPTKWGQLWLSNSRLFKLDFNLMLWYHSLWFGVATWILLKFKTRDWNPWIHTGKPLWSEIVVNHKTEAAVAAVLTVSVLAKRFFSGILNWISYPNVQKPKYSVDHVKTSCRFSALFSWNFFGVVFFADNFMGKGEIQFVWPQRRTIKVCVLHRARKKFHLISFSFYGFFIWSFRIWSKRNSRKSSNQSQNCMIVHSFGSMYLHTVSEVVARILLLFYLSQKWNIEMQPGSCKKSEISRCSPISMISIH